VICYFMVYLLFAPGIFVTSGGEDVGDRNRVGVYVACAAIIVVNTYILLNTYRWDWLMLLLTSLSTLLVFFWTGVWAASPTLAEFFYQAAAQVFSQPSFWAVTFLVVVVCLLPRFIIKFVQKVYFPYDVDIIREQVRQGKFKYLDDDDGSENAKSQSPSEASSDIAKPIARTTTTHNARSQNGSDGTDYTRHDASVEPPMEAPNPSRQSFDRPRPSFDRMRASMDRIRPSFEASHDFTSAALLTRMESSHSFGPIRSRRSNFTNNAR